MWPCKNFHIYDNLHYLFSKLKSSLCFACGVRNSHQDTGKTETQGRPRAGYWDTGQCVLRTQKDRKDPESAFWDLGNNHPKAYNLYSREYASCFSLANMKYSSLNTGLSLFWVPPFELHKKTTQFQVRSDQWSDIWVMRAMHYPIQPVAAPDCNHSSSRLTSSRWTSSPHNGSLGFWNASLLSPPKSLPWKWKLAKVGKWVDLDFRELFWKRCGSVRFS